MLHPECPPKARRRRGPEPVSADPWALNCPPGLVKCPQNMKSIIRAYTRDTLMQPNFYHMEFPCGPASIHGSTTTYSCLTQAASPNEHINPEISMKDHQIYIYCFLGSGPAIFPASVISSHACIVFLSEASSSSHVILQHCASAQTPGLRGVQFPLSNVL